MFLRVVRATVSKGVKRDYVRVVEAYRDDAGKTQHRTVIKSWPPRFAGGAS